MLRCKIQLPWKELIGLILLFSIGTMVTDGYTLDTGRHDVGVTHTGGMSLWALGWC